MTAATLRKSMLSLPYREHGNQRTGARDQGYGQREDRGVLLYLCLLLLAYGGPPHPGGRAKTMSRLSTKSRAPPAILNAEKLFLERPTAPTPRAKNRIAGGCSPYGRLALVRLAPFPGHSHEERRRSQRVEYHKQHREGVEQKLGYTPLSSDHELVETGP